MGKKEHLKAKKDYDEQMNAMNGRTNEDDSMDMDEYNSDQEAEREYSPEDRKKKDWIMKIKAAIRTNKDLGMDATELETC